MTIKVAMAQFASIDEVEANLTKIETTVGAAAALGAKLVAFHELATTNYFCFEHRNTKKFEQAEPIPGPSTDRICKAAADHGIHVIFPLYERANGIRYNTAAMIEPGEGVVGIYRKSCVPASRAHGKEGGAEENFYFSPGDTGYSVWETSLGLRIGILICYDRHHPEGQRAYGLQAADIVFVPTATYREFVTGVLWEAELQAMAFQNSYYVVGINKVGPVVAVEGKKRYPGRSLVVDPEGVIIERADDQEGLIVTDIDPAKPKQVRQVLRFFEYRRPDLYGSVVEPVAVSDS